MKLKLCHSFVLLFSCTWSYSLNAAESTDLNTSVHLPTQQLTMSPAWEIGVDAAATHLPAYTASASLPTGGYAIPWFVLRKGRLQVESEGFTLSAISENRFTLDISMTGSLNASSDDAPIRSGMPDIDYLVEVGPIIDYLIMERDVGQSSWIGLSWSNALRVALSTDFSDLRSRGVVYSTDLNFDYEGWVFPSLDLSISASSLWMSENMMDYLYQVDLPYVLDERALYDAKAGYLGSNLSLEAEYQANHYLSLYGGVVAEINSGSANRNSPLFEAENSVGAYFGINITIASSNTLVADYVD